MLSLIRVIWLPVRIFFITQRRGRIPLDSIAWYTLRTFVLMRDNYKCVECGKRAKRRSEVYGTFDVHHKIPISAGGSNHLSNLSTVCRACHKKHHSWI